MTLGEGGINQIRNNSIPTLDNRPLKRDSDHKKRKKKNRFRRRTATRPVREHHKAGFQMAKNYLSEKEPM